jgi:hypothetical protein
MSNEQANHSAIYMTLSLLCIAVANEKGIHNPVAWILMTLSAVWFFQSVAVLWQRAKTNA